MSEELIHFESKLDVLLWQAHQTTMSVATTMAEEIGIDVEDWDEEWRENILDSLIGVFMAAIHTGMGMGVADPDASNKALTAVADHFKEHAGMDMPDNVSVILRQLAKVR